MYSRYGVFTLLFVLFYGFAIFAYGTAFFLVYSTGPMSPEMQLVSLVLSVTGTASLLVFVWCTFLLLGDGLRRHLASGGKKLTFFNWNKYSQKKEEDKVS